MMHEIPDDVKRWTAKRRQTLILQLVRGETTTSAKRGLISGVHYTIAYKGIASEKQQLTGGSVQLRIGKRSSSTGVHPSLEACD